MKNNWPKTKAGCKQQIDALIRAYRQNFASGGAFGFDWRTFRLNDPIGYYRVQMLKRIWHELPEKSKSKQRLQLAPKESTPKTV